MTLDELKQNYIKIYEDRKLVFGEGPINSSIMLVGEAPGENEEKQGRAFVGKAGKNLDEFLKAVDLPRNDIYITNVVKFRPTKNSPKTGRLVNRPPSKEEIKDFMPLLWQEIYTIQPRLIVTLGNVPLKAVMKDASAIIGEVHGKLIHTDNLNVFPLYHPASIIYNQSLKEIYYGDLNQIKTYI